MERHAEPFVLSGGYVDDHHTATVGRGNHRPIRRHRERQFVVVTAAKTEICTKELAPLSIAAEDGELTTGPLRRRIAPEAVSEHQDGAGQRLVQQVGCPERILRVQSGRKGGAPSRQPLQISNLPRLVHQVHGHVTQWPPMASVGRPGLGVPPTRLASRTSPARILSRRAQASSYMRAPPAATAQPPCVQDVPVARPLSRFRPLSTQRHCAGSSTLSWSKSRRTEPTRRRMSLAHESLAFSEPRSADALPLLRSNDQPHPQPAMDDMPQGA